MGGFDSAYVVLTLRGKKTLSAFISMRPVQAQRQPQKGNIPMQHNFTLKYKYIQVHVISGGFMVTWTTAYLAILKKTDQGKKTLKLVLRLAHPRAQSVETPDAGPCLSD